MIAHECKNCGTALSGKYCSNCGQKAFTDHDRSILHFFEDAFHFITHFEGTFLYSLKYLILRPGQWSVDYSEGKRKRYFKPLSFFLFLVVAYLLFPIFQGLNMKLRFYTTLPLFGNWAQLQIENYLQANGLTFNEFAEVFAKTSEKLSKILLVGLIPLTSLPLLMLYPKRKKWYTDYLIISTEINNLFLLICFLIYPLIVKLLGTFIDPSYFGDNSILGNLANIVFMLMAGKACRTFFKQSLLHSIWKNILFLLFYFFIVFIVYRFILFVSVMALV